MEKKLTTPQYYPLTLNSVRLACNQKNNRDPVMDFTENEVFDLLERLHELGFVKSGLYEGSKTTKYVLIFEEIYGFSRADSAIVCELLNRGPQTPGELRSRCERMYPFKDLAEVEEILESLRTKGRVVMLERELGRKENRWAQLFCGEVVTSRPAAAAAAVAPARPRDELTERVTALESEVERLKARLEALEERG